MAWNEPGGKDKDPWGNGGNNNNDQGPPNLDEAFRKLQQKLGMLFNGGRPSSSSNGSGVSGTIVVLIMMIVLALYLSVAVFKLDAKEKAVILQLGQFKNTLGAGLHIYFPPFQKKFEDNTQQLRTYHIDQQMLTQDENIVDVSLSVQYNINSIKDYVLNVVNPDQTLREATQSALRHEVGSAKMIPILTNGREKLQIDVQNRLKEYVNRYRTGIDIIQVNIEKTSPPKDVQSAFDDVIRAREDEQHFKNKARAYAAKIVPQAQGEAARIIAASTAYQEAVVARAEGEATRFTQLLVEYQKAPKVTRDRLYLDTMQQVLSTSNKVLLDVKGANNLVYLPLDQLMKNHKASLKTLKEPTLSPVRPIGQTPSQSNINSKLRQNSGNERVSRGIR